MSNKNEDIEFSVGCGNIFKDMGYANPQEAQAKADLSRQIRKVIENRKLTQKQAANIMGIDQPKVSDIVRGKLSKYTLDRLTRFLRLLGQDVEIHVKKHSKCSEPANLLVVGICEKSRSSRKRASA